MRESAPDEIETRLGQRLKALRQARGWSLDALAAVSGVSRATLSRLENAEASATTSMLAKLCAAHGVTLSHLILQVESAGPALIRAADQPIWRDPETGFERRALSPPTPELQGEAIEGRLPAGRTIRYDAPSRPGIEHHLIMLEGALSLTLDTTVHALRAGDCVRYRLTGASRFETPPEQGARYHLFMF